MGAWSVSVTGNDTAQDLKSEYQAAFFYNDVETALEKIERYVRAEMCDESDEEEWCNYIYSLADFMWKKGILIDEIRQKARHATDEELRHNLERAIDNGNYIMEDEIRREMDRRGMYY